MACPLPTRRPRHMLQAHGFAFGKSDMFFVVALQLEPGQQASKPLGHPEACRGRRPGQHRTDTLDSQRCLSLAKRRATPPQVFLTCA